MKLLYTVLFLIFLTITSSSVSAADICATTDTVNGSYLVLDNDQKILIDDNGFSVSKLRLNNYCFLHKGTRDGGIIGRFYNKKNTDYYAVENFYTAFDSPDRQFTAIASGDKKGLITKISILDEKGLKHYNLNLDMQYDTDHFEMLFSTDSKNLNFYNVEEFSIKYTTLALDSGNLYNSQVDFEAYNDALKSDPNTAESSFAFFFPVSKDEFAASTANNYIGYYINGIALWTKLLPGQQGLSQILGVSNDDIVVFNLQSGIDLYRKSDGERRTIIDKVGYNFVPEEVDIKYVRFISEDKIFIRYATISKEGQIIINLDKMNVTKIRYI